MNLSIPFNIVSFSKILRDGDLFEKQVYFMAQISAKVKSLCHVWFEILL